MFESQPKDSHGYIYILSNVSMDGIYKVGLTRNSVAQRIKELNSTGVPTKFKDERIFEIQVKFLSQVEKIVHNKLKKNGHHHGKEFFRIDFRKCVTCVEDTIFEICGISSVDIVGLAKERKEAEERRREEKRYAEELKIKWEAQELARREGLLKIKNDEVLSKRAVWIKEQNVKALNQQKNEPVWAKAGSFLLMLIGAPIMLFILYAFGALLFESVGVFAGICLILFLVYWIYNKDKKDNESSVNRLEESAAKLYPLFVLDDIPTQAYRHEGVKINTGASTTFFNKVPNFTEKTDRAVHGRVDPSVEKKATTFTERSDRAVHGRVDASVEKKTTTFTERSDRAVHGRVDASVEQKSTTFSKNTGKAVLAQDGRVVTKDKFSSAGRATSSKRWHRIDGGLVNKLTGEFIPSDLLTEVAEPVPGFAVSSFGYSTVWIRMVEIEH